MVLNNLALKKKALFMFDKGKVFLNLFYQKIKNPQNHEDNFEFIWMILSLFAISE